MPTISLCYLLHLTCSVYEAGCLGEHAGHGTQHIPDVVQSLNKESQTTSLKPPSLLWKAYGALNMPSNVSCIKTPNPHATDVGSSVSHVLYPSHQLLATR